MKLFDYLHHIIRLVEQELGLKAETIPLSQWEHLIHARMVQHHLASVKDYFNFLEQSKDELQELIELVVIPETWFFRDRGVFDFLLFMLNHEKMTIPLKVLCLACSSGEEPYSIAMTLLEGGLSPDIFRVDAVDISKRAIAKAKSALYRKNSFRGRDLSYRYRYFIKTATGYQLSDLVKEQVNFYYANILKYEEGFAPHSYNVIFCKNLLIYLNADVQNQILKLVQSLLSFDGILVVGPAETQIVYNAGFIPIQVPNSYAFRMKSEEKKSKEHQATPEQMNPSVPSTREKEASQLLLEQALELADKGSFDESKQLCLDYIQQYGGSPETYYLLGIIHHAFGNDEKAEYYFHKTVYLNPSHYEALVCLALLSESQGELEKAELYRKRAEKSL